MYSSVSVTNLRSSKGDDAWLSGEGSHKVYLVFSELK